MKTIALFTFILLAFSAKSQSLKEALYGGKLKADTGAVIRKGDSLKIQENMSQKIAEDSVKKVVADSIKKDAIAVQKEKAIAAGQDTSAIAIALALENSKKSETAAAEKVMPKDNDEIWKPFIDSVSTTIKSEVLKSGKIKNGAYSVLVIYEINTQGQVYIKSVSSDPQNSFLEGQIKERLTLYAPQLNPLMGTNGKPRNATKKQMLSFVK